MKLTRLLVYILLFPATLAHAGESKIVDYVNTFIGTSNFGTTNPGAICPNGMMSVTPFNVMGSKLNTWDKDSRWWSTPYKIGRAHV